jgi:hypothetical protein
MMISNDDLIPNTAVEDETNVVTSSNSSAAQILQTPMNLCQLKVLVAK